MIAAAAETRSMAVYRLWQQ